jgi:transcriptional regulator NrdR family protein
MSAPRPGIACPDCQQTRHKVYGTRRTFAGSIVRYRACRSCGLKFKTTERTGRK